MRLHYALSEPYRQRVFIETGETVPAKASVELPAEAITPEMRAHIVRSGRHRLADYATPAQWDLTGYEHNRDGVGGLWPGAMIVLDAPATDADAARLFADDMARWEDVEARRRLAAQAAAERQEQQRAKDAVEAERRRVAQLAEAAEKAARLAERERWIAAHGSEFLVKASGAGYDCQRKYVVERAALERPGFIVDFDDRADWKSRACPSERALDEALAVNGTVVWLTRPPYRDDDEFPQFDEGEAVVIRGYLGQYDLIRTF